MFRVSLTANFLQIIIVLIWDLGLKDSIKGRIVKTLIIVNWIIMSNLLKWNVLKILQLKQTKYIGNYY